MSYSNGLLSDQSHKSANKYVQGLPGVGFKLTDTGDYDMQNRKLTNTKEGTENNDVVTKLQLDNKTTLIDGARPSYITNDKAVIYSGTGAVHAKSVYLQDYNEDEVRILTDNQDFDNVHLFVPNLKNFDGFGGRKRSEIMVTSVDQKQYLEIIFFKISRLKIQQKMVMLLIKIMLILRLQNKMF